MMRGNWNFWQILVSGLATAIFFNYLITGFIDIVININSLLTWLQNSGTVTLINQLIKQVLK